VNGHLILRTYVGAYRVPLTHRFQVNMLQNHKHEVPIPGGSATPAEFFSTRKPFSDASIKLNCILHYNHVILLYGSDNAFGYFMKRSQL